MLRCMIQLADSDLVEAEMLLETMDKVTDEKKRSILKRMASAAVERHAERHEHITEEPTCEVGKAYHHLVHNSHAERAARIKHLLERK